MLALSLLLTTLSPTADEILECAKQAYASLKTYQDTATVRQNYPNRTAQVSSFRTSFKHPNQFCIVETNNKDWKGFDATKALWIENDRARYWFGRTRDAGPVVEAGISGDDTLFASSGQEFRTIAEAFTWTQLRAETQPASPARFLGSPSIDPLRDQRYSMMSEATPWTRQPDATVNGIRCDCVSRRLGHGDPMVDYSVYIDKTQHLVRRIDSHAYDPVVVDYFPVANPPIAESDLRFEIPSQTLPLRAQDRMPLPTPPTAAELPLAGSPDAIRVLAKVRRAYSDCRSYTDTGESMDIQRGSPMAEADNTRASHASFETNFHRRAGFRMDTTDLDAGPNFRRYFPPGFDRHTTTWTTGSITRRWMLSRMTTESPGAALPMLQSFESSLGESEGPVTAGMWNPNPWSPLSLLFPSAPLSFGGKATNKVSITRNELLDQHRCFVIDVEEVIAQQQPLHGKGAFIGAGSSNQRFPGHATGNRGQLLWIDYESYAIRKTASNDGDHTATYHPIFNAPIPPAALTFGPPQARFLP